MTQITVTIKDASKVSIIQEWLEKIEGVTVSLPKIVKKVNKEKKDNIVDLSELITPYVKSLGVKPQHYIDDDEAQQIISDYISEKYK